MTARSFVLIANPHAGRGQAAKVAGRTEAALRSAGAAVHSEMTTSIEHATALATSAALAGDVSVAIGGDGLLSAVAAGASRHRGTVGIVPCGRGNDYARMVGITEVGGCVKVLLEAKPRPADCIAVSSGLTAAPTVTAPPAMPSCLVTAVPGADTAAAVPHRVAIGNVYLGFDSLSNVLANQITVNLGQFSYSYTALRVAISMRPLMFRLVLDGKPTEYTGSGVAIANSAYYGHGVPVAPRADVHDGLLDVMMFEQTTRRSRVALLLAMRSGKHQQRSGVNHVRARRVHVVLEPPLEAYSDGDPIGRTPLTAWVLPGAIQVLRP